MEGFISQFAQGGRLIFPDSAYTISCGVQLINFVTDIIIISVCCACCRLKRVPIGYPNGNMAWKTVFILKPAYISPLMLLFYQCYC